MVFDHAPHGGPSSVLQRLMIQGASINFHRARILYPTKPFVCKNVAHPADLSVSGELRRDALRLAK